HEVHAAEDDHVGVDPRRLAGELERVADEVGHLEELRTLVVVREDDGVPLPLERRDLGDRVGDRGAAGGRIRRVAERREERFEGGGGGGFHRDSFVYEIRMPIVLAQVGGGG